MGLRKVRKAIQLNRKPVDKTLHEVRLKKRHRFVRRRTLTFFTMSLLLIGFALLPLIKNYQQTNKLKLVHAQSVEELEEVQSEQEDLKYQIKLLEDEEYIAKLARQELNLSRPNEILINLPKKEETKSEEELEKEELEAEEDN